MDYLEFAFRPLNMALIHFGAFAFFLAAGISMGNILVMFVSFAFFLSGASIGVFHVVGNVIKEDRQETKVVTNAMPKTNIKIQAAID